MTTFSLFLFQVFLWRHWEIFANDGHLLVADGTAPKPSFSKPSKGTSMEEFRTMVTTYVDDKLSSGDHSSLVERIMNTADVNNDSKVSFCLCL